MMTIAIPVAGMCSWYPKIQQQKINIVSFHDNICNHYEKYIQIIKYKHV